MVNPSGKRGRERRKRWENALRRYVSVVVSATMVAQGLMPGGMGPYAFAWGQGEEIATSEDAKPDADADGAGAESDEAGDKSEGAAERGDDATSEKETADKQGEGDDDDISEHDGEVDGNDAGQGDDAGEEPGPTAGPVDEDAGEVELPAKEQQGDAGQVGGPAIAGLAVRNETTGSNVASATGENALHFEVSYEGLEPREPYEALVELVDPEHGENLRRAVAPESGEASVGALEYRTSFAAEQASGVAALGPWSVDLHDIAGEMAAVRMTLLRDGEQVATRTFDALGGAVVCVPALESALQAADGSERIVAEEAPTEGSAVVDEFAVTGVPEGTEVLVSGALATTEGEAVAAGAANAVAAKDGVARARIEYPAFEARRFAGKELASTLTARVNDKVVATYPSPAGRRRPREATPKRVSVVASTAQGAVSDAGADGQAAGSEDGEGGDAGGDEADDAEDDEPSASAVPAEPEDAHEESADIPTPTGSLLEELGMDVLSTPADAQPVTSGASVSRDDAGVVAVNLQGTATRSAASAMAALSKEVGRPEALLLAASLGNGASETRGSASEGTRGATAAGSTSSTLDGFAAGAPPRDNRDGNNIEDIRVSWISKDEFVDDDDDLLSRRPGSVDVRSDANQSIVAQIDYSVSGEHDYEAGDLRIMVPASMFALREGGQAGDVVIPLAEAPSLATDFNWQLVDDYYVFTNTHAMSAATKGFIQVMWVNLTPHQVADAYASIHTDGQASAYDEGASHVTDEHHTAPWYAYMEVTTFRGNTLRAVSNEIRALMDTGEVVDAAYKRVTGTSPQVVDANALPAGTIPAQYVGESKFVVVDWYMHAHHRGNQPFSLDVDDALLLEQDRASGVERDGFVYQTSIGEAETFSAARDRVTGAGIYAGWPKQTQGNTAYIHVYSAYPLSQFATGREYTFHNQVTYTLNPIDGQDTPTTARATQAVSFSLHDSTFIEPPGHFNVFKWGNDGWEDRATIDEYDYVAHDPDEEARTISRKGTRQHYNGWYGIYEDAINQLRDGKDVSLWYTIKTEGWVLPWTLEKPASSVTAAHDGFEWARWDEATQRYVAATGPVDPQRPGEYELVEYYLIQDNYLKRPVTMVTTDRGLYVDGTVRADEETLQRLEGGTALTAGSDYTFDFVEFEKPLIGTLEGVNVRKGERLSVSTAEDGTFDYAADTDDAHIPVIDLYVEVDGAWQEAPYATVDWSGGWPSISSAGDVAGATVKLPPRTTNLRTEVTTTRNAYLMSYLYPRVTLTPAGKAKLRAYAQRKFVGREGQTVYQPRMWVQNGVEMDAYGFAQPSATQTSKLVHLEKWGEDRLDGYTADLAVYPAKRATFDQVTDVDFVRRTATVHYDARVEERTFITDEETYRKALASGELEAETAGTWYDLLPEGMTPVLNTVRLRDADAVREAYVEDDWRGTGRKLLVVKADLTPVPTSYKRTPMEAASYWEDVPSLALDAVMDIETWVDLGGNAADIETGIAAHNVVAFQSGNDVLGTVSDYAGEPDRIDVAAGNNVRTRTGAFTSEEVAALADLDPAADKPNFVYADVETRLAFPTAARTSLSKNIMVNDDGRWSQGTYDDVRTVWEGGFYSYRLRMMSDANTKSKDLVLYDSLENYYAVDGNDDADIDAPRWRGHLAGVDVSQIRSLGCRPVVYYSTIDNLVLTDARNARRSNAANIDITNRDIWVRAEAYAGDLKDIHAIAIDCTRATGGGEFVLQPETTLTAIVRMHAPWGTERWDDFADIARTYEDGGSARSYIAADAHAYNNVYLVSTSVDASADFPENSQSTRDFIRFDYTKVGLKEYEVPVTKVWDDDGDRDGLRPRKAEVTLYANGVPAGSEVVGDAGNIRVLSEENGWHATYQHLPYTDESGKRITYRVAESKGQVPEGYTAFSRSDAAGAFTVINRHAPERIKVEGTKTWEGDEADPSTRPAYVDVQLCANGIVVRTMRVKPREEFREGGERVLVWPTYCFDDLYKYDHGAEIEYSVREVMPTSAYVSTVDGYDLTNRYHPFGDVSLTKRVTGETAAVADKRYAFHVTLERPLGDGAYEPLAESFAWESSAGARGTVADGGTLQLAGGETVTIRDLPNAARVTFDEDEYAGFTTSTGSIKAVNVLQNRTREVIVGNVYHATGSLTVTAFKQLTGARLRNNAFTFELVDESGRVVRTATNRADGSVTFGSLTYGSADDGMTFSYVMREQVPRDATNAQGVTYGAATEEQRVAGGFSLDGYTYARQLYTVLVSVRDKEGRGELDAQVRYVDAKGRDVTQEVEARCFQNAYHARGTARLTAWKVLDAGGLDRALQEGEFAFELVPLGGTDAAGKAVDAANVPMPSDGSGAAGAAGGTDVVANDARGIVSFDELTYDEGDAGCTYCYVAREVAGDDRTVVYSDAAFGYEVCVEDNGDGTMAATTSFFRVGRDDAGAYVAGDPTDELPVFVNALAPGSLSIEKRLQGSDDVSQEFRFHVRLTGEDVRPDATYEYELERIGDGAQAGAASPQASEPQGAGPLDFLAGLLAPTPAYAAEDGLVVSGNLYLREDSQPGIAWDLYEDGTLRLRPEEGDEGTCVCTRGTDRTWANYKDQIRRVETVGNLHFVGSMSQLFLGLQNLESVDLSSLDTSRVTEMYSLFEGCTSLTSLDIADLDTSAVTNMGSVFRSCESLTSLPIEGWDVSACESFQNMFRKCTSLASLDLSGWDTTSLKHADYVFEGCSALTSLDVSNWSFPHATSMKMFVSGCTSLTDFRYEGWDVSGLLDMWSFFSNDPSLEEVDLSEWDMTNVTNDLNIFYGCSGLRKIVLGTKNRFRDAVFPTPPVPMSTGKWMRADGSEALAASTLMARYKADPVAYADTWVWQEAAHTLRFDAGGGTGVMADLSVPSVEFALPKCTFANGDATFAGWVVGSGTSAVLGDQEQMELYANGSGRGVRAVGSDRGYQLTDEGDGSYGLTLRAAWTYDRFSIVFRLAEPDEAAGASGSMQPVSVKAGEAYDLPSAGLYWFRHVLTGWVVSVVDKDGRMATGRPTRYDAGATVAADDFVAGDKVTLTATWAEVETTVHAADGEFVVTLHGGERATFADLPAGTAYEVWEEAPDGWKLIEATGTDGLVQPGATARASFVNRHVGQRDATATAALHATKVVRDERGGEQAVEEGAFRFRLYEGTGTDAVLLQTVKNGPGGDVSFRELSYDAPGTYTYTMREVAGDDASFSYDEQPIMATVEVVEEAGEDGATVLVAKEPVYAPEVPVFANVRVPLRQPATHRLTIRKLTTGAPAGPNPTFVFVVRLSDDLGRPLPKDTELEVDGRARTLDAAGRLAVHREGAGTIAIEGLPEGTVFSVEEDEVPAGWTLVDERGTQGVLAGGDASAELTNAYAARGLVSLRAYKALEGAQLREGDFAFGLFADEACTRLLQTRTNAAPEVGGAHAGTGVVSFAPILLTEAGRSTYYIKEIAGRDHTIEYDETVVTAVVEATDDGSGRLATTVTYAPDAALITNVKKPGSITIAKSVLDAPADGPARSFPVMLTLTGPDGGKLEGRPWTSSRDDVAGGTIASGELLTIHEGEVITIGELPEGTRYEAAEGEADGFTQESATDAEGVVASDEVRLVSFVNRYDVATFARLEARKLFVGGTLEAGAFHFQLKSGERVVSEAANDEHGVVSFDPLPFSMSDAGKEFSYRMLERQGDAAGVTYDRTVYDVTVRVRVNDGGELVADVSYAQNGEAVVVPTFTNRYEATGSFLPKVTKRLAGKRLKERQFEFVLRRADGAPLSAADARTQLTARNDTAGTVAFDAVRYDQNDVGRTYTYLVSEVDDAQPGITYDGHTLSMRVSIADKGDGSLAVTPEYGEGREVFANDYLKPATAELFVRKRLEGRDWMPGDTFAFVIEADKANPDATAVPRMTSVTITAEDKGEPQGFGPIVFNRAGNYLYRIREVRGSLKRMAYDAAVHVVSVDVARNDANELVATVDYGGLGSADAPGDALVVTNTYTPDKPDFRKQIADCNDSTGVRTGWQDSADYDIGDEVPYRLLATLPDDVTAYKSYGVAFEDKMERGLTFRGVTRVAVAGVELDETQYELDVDKDKHGFDLGIRWGGNGLPLTEALNGAAVEVEFTATLNQGAVLGKPGNVNKARLGYSNRPVVDAAGGPSEDEGMTPWDYAIAFTYRLGVNKVDREGNALEGARFRLEKQLADGSSKRIALSASANAFSATGIDDGVYVLTETEAPEGYRLAEPITFEVKANHRSIWMATNETGEVPASRADVLAGLTGDVRMGQIALEATDGLEGLEGGVVDERETNERADLVIGKRLADALADSSKARDDEFGFSLWLEGLSQDGNEAETFVEFDAVRTKADGDVEECRAGFTRADDGSYRYMDPHHTSTGGAGGLFLRGGESLRIVGLPIGASFTVAEEPTSGYRLAGIKLNGAEVARLDDAGDIEPAISGVVGADGCEVAFTNEAEGSPQARLKVTKEVRGAAYGGEEEFSFVLAPIDGSPMPEQVTTTARAGETSSFAAVSYANPGTYYYTINEVVPDEPTLGMSYSTESVWAKVTVPEELDEASIVYGGSKTACDEATNVSSEAACVTNEYTVPETTALEVRKSVSSSRAEDKDGRYPFRVTLYESDGVTVHKLSGAYGGMEFKEGIAEFELGDGASRRASGLPRVDGGLRCGVEETDTGGMASQMTREVSEGGALTVFTCTNTRRDVPPDATAELRVTKRITGDAYSGSEEFSFVLTGVDGAPMPESTEAKARAGHAASFGKVAYEAPGTYFYTIAEVEPERPTPGMSYRKDAVWARVEVREDRSVGVSYGTEDEVRAGGGSENATVVNTYAKEDAPGKESATKDAAKKDAGAKARTPRTGDPSGVATLAAVVVAGVIALTLGTDRRHR